MPAVLALVAFVAVATAVKVAVRRLFARPAPTGRAPARKGPGGPRGGERRTPRRR